MNNTDFAPSVNILSDAARQNVETGVLLLCKEALVTAIQDRRLERAHLRVLACVVQFVNRTTAKAWPDRQTIAKMTGLTAKTVSNRLKELRDFGYLIADREPVEEANNRSLTVYTFGNIDHDTIRAEIAKFVDAVKQVRDGKDASPAALMMDHGAVPAGRDSPGPQGHKSPGPQGQSRPAGTVDEGEVPAGRARKSRPAGFESPGRPGTVTQRRNSEKELNKLASLADAPAGARNADFDEAGEPPKRKPGTRLPKDWVLPRAWGMWAMDHFVVTRDDVLTEAAAFKDFWTAKSGNAAKRDWEATWRNWIRNSRRGFRRRAAEAGISPDLLTAPTRTKSADELELERELAAVAAFATQSRR